MLEPGSRFGVYDVLAAIGAGGMGEVYRARDTRLKRDVALKILPEVFAADRERLARFQREAEVLASLNHPHIAAIYGLEESSGVSALVLELVEGETLADRIERGPIPMDEALPIARQIVEALETAHERGVVHRDLKPANIKVTPEGAVKVLDFGLAKLIERPVNSESVADLTASPTITSPATATGVGVLLGTAAYMAPEQAKGQTADKRCDVWAFGCVLYEMLTGMRAFQGEDVSDTLAAVLRGQPDWNALPGDTPAALRAVLRRCVERDRRERVADISTVRFVIAERATLAGTTGRHIRTGSKSWLAASAAASIVLAAAISGWALRNRGTEPLKPLVRLDVDLGQDVSLSATQGQEVVISPDGTRIVYVSNRRLYSRLLNEPSPVELKGTEGGFAPFFAPDGHAIGFLSGRELKTFTFNGGFLTKVCDGGPLPRTGSWGDDGTIVVDLNLDNTLSAVPATGGRPVPLTALDPSHHDTAHRTPFVLPGSGAVMFAAISDTGVTEIRAMSLRTRKTTSLHPGMFPRFVATSNGQGFLLFVQGTTILAERFNPDTLVVESSPVPVFDPVTLGASFAAQFDVSSGGSAVLQSGAQTTRAMVIQWLSPAGRMPLVSTPREYGRVAVSPDGSRIAFQLNGREGEVFRDAWLYDTKTKTMRRLTFNDGQLPRWSPDGRYIAYRNDDGMYWIRTDGTGDAIKFTAGQQQFPQTFTPDGRQLLFQQTIEGKNDIWGVRVPQDMQDASLQTPHIVLQGPHDERHPALSPDGKWLAYSSDEAGQYQVYVRPFPAVDEGKWQIAGEEGLLYPIWSKSENRLFFRSTANQVFSAAYRVEGAAFIAQQPQLWSQEHLADLGVAGSQNYDLAPDGSRVAAVMPATDDSGRDQRHHVVFLTNFVDELRRRLALER